MVVGDYSARSCFCIVLLCFLFRVCGGIRDAVLFVLCLNRSFGVFFHCILCCCCVCFIIVYFWYVFCLIYVVVVVAFPYYFRYICVAFCFVFVVIRRYCAMVCVCVLFLYCRFVILFIVCGGFRVICFLFLCSVPPCFVFGLVTPFIVCLLCVFV